MSKAKKLLSIVGKIVSILSIIYIVYAIYKIGFDVSSITNWPVFLGVALISVIAKCATVYMMGAAWGGWLAFFSGHDIDRREALCVYAKANIGKYLPGNVMHYVERNLFAGKLGMTQKQLAGSSIIEVLGLVMVAFVMAVLISANQLTEAFKTIFGDNYKTVIGIAIIVILACAVIFWLLFRKKLKGIIEGYSFGSFVRTFLQSILQYALVLVIMGAIMVALYAYMGGIITIRNAALIISGYIIAWVFGFVVPGASGGIGVRELVITLLLGSVVGANLVVTLSVIHRLITIIGDFLAYVVMLVLRRKTQ